MRRALPLLVLLACQNEPAKFAGSHRPRTNADAVFAIVDEQDESGQVSIALADLPMLQGYLPTEAQIQAELDDNATGLIEVLINNDDDKTLVEEPWVAFVQEGESPALMDHPASGTLRLEVEITAETGPTEGLARVVLYKEDELFADKKSGYSEQIISERRFMPIYAQVEVVDPLDEWVQGGRSTRRAKAVSSVSEVGKFVANEYTTLSPNIRTIANYQAQRTVFNHPGSLGTGSDLVLAHDENTPFYDFSAIGVQNRSVLKIDPHLYMETWFATNNGDFNMQNMIAGLGDLDAIREGKGLPSQDAGSEEPLPETKLEWRFIGVLELERDQFGRITDEVFHFTKGAVDPYFLPEAFAIASDCLPNSDGDEACEQMMKLNDMPTDLKRRTAWVNLGLEGEAYGNGPIGEGVWNLLRMKQNVGCRGTSECPYESDFAGTMEYRRPNESTVARAGWYSAVDRECLQILDKDCTETVIDMGEGGYLLFSLSRHTPIEKAPASGPVGGDVDGPFGGDVDGPFGGGVVNPGVRLFNDSVVLGAGYTYDSRAIKIAQYIQQ